MNHTAPVVREIAQILAHLVHSWVYPGEYHRIHIDNGRRFEVIVRLYVTPEDTQPLKRVDEDDQIS